jgi:hydrogenase maturation protein HypF
MESLVQAIQQGQALSEIGSRFHRTIAEMIARMCQLLRQQRGLHTVALSGGCFQNRQLLRLSAEALRSQGFSVLLHRQVPCNDGGLSLGQAVIAHFLQGGRS